MLPEAAGLSEDLKIEEECLLYRSLIDLVGLDSQSLFIVNYSFTTSHEVKQLLRCKLQHRAECCLCVQERLHALLSVNTVQLCQTPRVARPVTSRWQLKNL